MFANSHVQVTVWGLLRFEGCDEKIHLVREEQANPTVVRPDCSGSDPDHFTCRAQCVEIGCAISAHTKWQDI